MPLQETVEHLPVADRELAAHDARVVHAQDGVDVLHALCADIGKILDLRRRVLDLVVRHLQAELLHPRLDRVPAGQPVATRARARVSNGMCGEEAETGDAPDRDVARETEILGLEDLIGRGVV